MNIPDKIIRKWVTLLDRGEKGKIAAYCGCSYKTVNEALKGKASCSIVIKINEYFRIKYQKLR